MATKAIGIDLDPVRTNELFKDVNFYDSMKVTLRFLESIGLEIPHEIHNILLQSNPEQIVETLNKSIPDSHWSTISTELLNINTDIHERTESEVKLLQLKTIMNHITWKAGQDERATYEGSADRVNKTNYQNFEGMILGMILLGMCRELESNGNMEYGASIEEVVASKHDKRQIELIKKIMSDDKSRDYIKIGLLRASMEIFKDLSEPMTVA